ncbi:MAG: hypothetical protein ACOX4K_01875 [Bacillota bacterium]|jgi:hypothetical protein
MFNKAMLPLRNFYVGERFAVDTTDFGVVDYDDIDAKIAKFVCPS